LCFILIVLYIWSLVYATTSARHQIYTTALVSQKGDSGKSTVAVRFALCAQLNFHALAVIDLDRHASAKAWAAQRHDEALSVVSALPNDCAGFFAKRTPSAPTS
jgi:cellulose biosynthesis protein BcsQ